MKLILCYLLAAPAWCQDIGPTHPVMMGARKGLVRSGLVGAWNLSTVNLLKWSEDFSNAAWTIFGTASATSTSVTFGATEGAAIYQTAIPGIGTYTFQCLVSSATNHKFKLVAYDGAVKNSTGFTTSATPQWFSYTFTSTGIGNVQVRNSNDAVAGTISVSGCQLNEGTTALPYQATTDLQRVPVGTSGSMPIRREIGGAVVYDPAPDAASKYTYSNGETRAVAGTNLLTYSEDFTKAKWYVWMGTKSYPGGTSPTGAAPVKVTINNAADQNAQLYEGTAYAAGTYTSSIYSKADGFNYASLLFVANQSRVYANLTDCTVSYVGAGVSGAAASVGDGWCRITATYTGSPSQITVGCNEKSNNPMSTGDGVKGCLFSGFQLNPGTLPDAYTKTEAVALEPSYYWLTNGTTTSSDTNDGVRRYLGLVMDGVDDRLLALPTKGSAWTVINCSGAHCYGVDSASGSFVDGIKTAGASEFALTTAGGYSGTLSYLLYYSRVLTPREHAQNYFQVIKPAVNARGGTLP